MRGARAQQRSRMKQGGIGFSLWPPENLTLSTLLPIYTSNYASKAVAFGVREERLKRVKVGEAELRREGKRGRPQDSMKGRGDEEFRGRGGK